MKLKIDKGKCIGCELCVQLCEASFKMDGEKASPVCLDCEKTSAIEDAIDSCPVGAICCE